MNGHLEQLLDAYLDGELDASQMRRAESHLEGCPECRGELERRRVLSAILQAAPAPAGGKSEQRFVSEIALRLPRKSAAVRPGIHAFSAAWTMIPAVALFLAWAFLQSAAIVVDAVNWIPGAENALQAGLMASVPQISIPDLGGASLAGLISWDGAALTVALIGIGLLFIGWFAGWWVSQRAAESQQ
jgi:anti-sigma factor RsiW